ncbi:MAG: acetate kinase [candidate division SR1 bacterium]|nr:acetate kinase [candidate division SR1 bacterium]
MKILVLNSGSSSLKFQVIDMENETLMIKGIVEKIGIEGSFLDYHVAGDSVRVDQQVKDHHEAVHLMFDVLTGGEFQILGSLSELTAIGHRVVHGGEYFSAAVKIDDAVIEKIQLCSDLAPLHNPANLAGIAVCSQLLPNIPQVAVFDTAFHQTMPAEYYLYPIPYEYYTKYRVRRYGFHGTSHEYVFNKRAELFKTSDKQTRVITCHIGNGASLTAIMNGEVLETSMGMTPLGGLMMGTRSGDIDPGIITMLMKKEGLTPDKMENILNKKSGLLGVSEKSSDLRDTLAGWKAGDERSTITLAMYVDSIVKYIGAYVALMNGVDAIVLTAGIMERSEPVRKLLLEKLARLGSTLDAKKNIQVDEERCITTKDSQVPVYVIPTNEELMIAEETRTILKSLAS